MKKKFLYWVVGWANLIDGLCIVFTLGLWTGPFISLYAESAFLDFAEKERQQRNKK